MNTVFLHENAIASIILIVTIYIVRAIVIQRLRAKPSDNGLETKRRWINTIKNTSHALIAIGIIVIWLSEIQAFAFSIAAFVVALVISTKEYIQCVIGSLYRTSARTFAVGDWIQVGTHVGEVTNTDWLSTTLFEVDFETPSYAYTGKTLVIPNSQFVMQPLKNLSFMKQYVSHSFAIVRDGDEVNLHDLRDFVLTKLKEYSAHFEEVAAQYNKKVERRMDIKIDGPEPSVRIQTTNIGKNIFTVTVFCPTGEAVELEQKISNDFFIEWHRLRALAKKDAEKAKVDN